MKRRNENTEISQQKTYLCTLMGNEQLLSRLVVIAYNAFDAMSKCSTKFNSENMNLSTLTLQIEEADVIR